MGNGNTWTKSKTTTIDHAAVLEAYRQVARLSPRVREKSIYSSARQKEILGWPEMSEPAARELHVAIMVAIRFPVPNQVMIDDFWISIRRDARFTQSYGRYHCGCMVGAPGGSEALEQLAIRLGKMLGLLRG